MELSQPQHHTTPQYHIHFIHIPLGYAKYSLIIHRKLSLGLYRVSHEIIRNLLESVYLMLFDCYEVCCTVLRVASNISDTFK
jgi:hypothetical protein